MTSTNLQVQNQRHTFRNVSAHTGKSIKDLLKHQRGFDPGCDATAVAGLGEMTGRRGELRASSQKEQAQHFFGRSSALDTFL